MAKHKPEGSSFYMAHLSMVLAYSFSPDASTQKELGKAQQAGPVQRSMV